MNKVLLFALTLGWHWRSARLCLLIFSIRRMFYKWKQKSICLHTLPTCSFKPYFIYMFLHTLPLSLLDICSSCLASVRDASVTSPLAISGKSKIGWNKCKYITDDYVSFEAEMIDWLLHIALCLTFPTLVNWNRQGLFKHVFNPYLYPFELFVEMSCKTCSGNFVDLSILPTSERDRPNPTYPTVYPYLFLFLKQKQII